MKKKVLYVITKGGWGGAQRYVFDLATSLPKEQFDIAVVLGGDGLLAKKLEEQKTTIYRSLLLQRDVSLFTDVRSFFELRRLFIHEAPDVVHLNSSKAGGVGALAARLAGVKNIIFTSHGLAWEEDRNLVSKIVIYVATWLTFLLCHKVITITQSNYERARRMPFCKHKIVLIRNGIAPQTFLPRQEARAALAKHLRPLPNAELWIGSVGELTRNKGQRYLFEAARLLKAKGTPFALILLGDGEDRKALERQMERAVLKNDVYMPGFLPDAAQYLPAFDMFVLPSLKEGLPYVLLEAAEAGVPVVATNVGGVPDILGGDSPVRPKDAAALAEALQSLISNEGGREQASAALKIRTEKEFSLAKMVAQTSVLY